MENSTAGAALGAVTGFVSSARTPEPISRRDAKTVQMLFLVIITGFYRPALREARDHSLPLLCYNGPQTETERMVRCNGERARNVCGLVAYGVCGLVAYGV